MRTATITWITYSNYGTYLQAYALQSFLKNNNIENVIISDENMIPYKVDIVPSKKKIEIDLWADLTHPWRIAMKCYYCFKHFRSMKSMKSYYSSQKKILEFKNKKLDIVYGFNRENVKEKSEQFDLFFCGSDQIWSTFPQNFDGYYFLDFTQKKKIAYSCSIGTENIPLDKQEQIVKWLKDFKAVSVREKLTSEQLTFLTGKKVKWVCDPTLLFDSSFWENITTRKICRRKYLLCYFLEDKDWYYERAIKYAQKNGLKLLLIPSIKSLHKRRIYQPQNIGIEEFVGLFREANYVMTDSYHGSIFSLIFNKQFTYFKRFSDDDPISQNIRINSLFGYLRIMNRIQSENDEDISCDNLLDYKSINQLIEVFRNESIRFLTEALEDKGDF